MTETSDPDEIKEFVDYMARRKTHGHVGYRAHKILTMPEDRDSGLAKEITEIIQEGPFRDTPILHLIKEGAEWAKVNTRKVLRGTAEGLLKTPVDRQTRAECYRALVFLKERNFSPKVAAALGKENRDWIKRSQEKIREALLEASRGEHGNDNLRGRNHAKRCLLSPFVQASIKGEKEIPCERITRDRTKVAYYSSALIKQACQALGVSFAALASPERAWD